MTIQEMLAKEKYLLNESGIRIPENKESFKILHHDDADGVGSAKAVREQIQNQISKRWRKENKKIGGKSAKEMSDKELKSAIDKRISFDKVTDGSKPEDVLKKIKAAGPKQMLLVVDFDRFKQFGDDVMKAIKNRDGFDFHSDHHQTDEKSSGKTGKTGATDFKSDTEHISTKYTVKGFDPKTAIQFSKWDSASFDENIKKELGIEKGDKAYKPIRELSAILGSISRKNYDKKAIDYFIKNSESTLISMLRTARKLKDVMNKRAEASEYLKKAEKAEGKKKKELKKKSEKIRQDLVDSGFKDFAAEISKDAKTKKIYTDLSGKNKKDYEDRDEYFKGANKYVVVSDLKGRKQPNRYLGFTVPNDVDPEMKKYLSMIRYWEGMSFMQVSISPDAPKEVKEYVDLGEVSKKVLAETEEKFGNKFNKWAFDIIKSEAGGHKGITNVGGFYLLGLMPKKFRKEEKELRPIVKRIKSISKFKGKKGEKNLEEFLEKTPGLKKKLSRLKELEGIKDDWKQNKKKIMGFVRDRFAHYVEQEMNKAMKKESKEEILKVFEGSL